MKKLISILLVLIVFVNAVGFGFLNVRSSASPIGYAIWEVAKGFAIGIIGGAAGQAAYGTGEAVGELSSQWHLNQIKNDLENDSLVFADVDETGLLTFYVSSNCSSESAEFASILCSELNSLNEMERRPNLYGSYNITADSYKNVKNKCMNAYIDYMNAQAQAEAASGLGDTLSELGAVTYPFDFSGPLTSMTMPSTSGAVSLDMNGFHFTPPYRIGMSQSYSTEEEAINHGGSIVQQSGSSYVPYQSYNAYGYGFYVIYGGEMYFNGGYSANRDISTMTVRSQQPDFNTWNSSSWVSASGVRLCDVHTFTADEIDNGALVGGVMFHTEYKDWDHRFPFSYSYSPEDFIVAEMGEDITLDRTPAEDAIGSAMGLDLVSSNPTISIDPTTGEITAVDGISLATLENLISQLSEGQIKFDDIEGYLQTIVAILQANGTDQKTISAILQGIRSNTKDIADINAAVQSIAESITAVQEITAEKDFDIDTPTTIIDKFPFCLPFDVYNTFNLLSAQPVAPKFTLPLKMEGVFDFSISVDFTEYEWIANIVRWLLYVVFILGLILATNKLIGRG